ncbi:MAG: hypothetical protein DWQ05_21115 [Calditrichaeota bacterium]|nr:MAG: hypothetical protein DWQ05_21115 [Calditrichota bacterium]
MLYKDENPANPSDNDKNLEKMIKYIKGELLPDEVDEFEAELTENNKYLSAISAIIKKRETKLTPEEEIEFASIYQAPQQDDRRQFMEVLRKSNQAPIYSAATIRKFVSVKKAAILIPIAALIILMFNPTFNKSSLDSNQFLTNYFHDVVEKKSTFRPSELDGSTSELRSSDAGNANTFSVIENDFWGGYSDYISDYFIKASAKVDNILAAKNKITTLTETPDGRILLNDIYFLKAMSHFGRAIETMESKGNYSPHLTTAIHELNYSSTFASSHGLQASGRELYFLGLAYHFAGKADSAKQYLSRIDQSHNFYTLSRDLLNQLD